MAKKARAKSLTDIGDQVGRIDRALYIRARNQDNSWEKYNRDLDKVLGVSDRYRSNIRTELKRRGLPEDNIQDVMNRVNTKVPRSVYMGLNAG